MNKEMVRDLFEYRDDNLYWRVRPRGGSDISKPAGYVMPKGYRRIAVKGKRYLTHRLIWLYTNGKFPDNHIDHINGDPSDNRIENLRDVTRQENQKNRSKNCNNKSGYMGVCWSKASDKWKAQIRVGGVKTHLGLFNILEDAAEAYRVASIEQGYHENHGRD